jgi:outer membrane protein
MRQKSFKLPAVAALLWMAAQASTAQTVYALYQQALENSPALLRRQADMEQARAQKDMAQSRLLPQISADFTRTPEIRYNEDASGTSQRYGGTRRSLQLRQTLVDGSAWTGLETARGQVMRADQAHQAGRMSTVADLTERYVAALQAQDEGLRLDAEMKAVHTQVQRLERMRERQMAKVTDLYEAQAYLLTLQTQALDAAVARQVALEKLQEITGAPVTEVYGLTPGAHVGVEVHTVTQWEEDATANNPLLASLRAAVDAAKSQVKAARYQHAPVLSLVVSSLYADQGYDSRLQPPYQVESAGLQLSIPLYEGGRVNAVVRDALARQSAAEQEYETARREVIRQVRSSYLLVASGKARVESTEREWQTRQRVVEAQEKALLLGAVTIIDVLDSRRRVLKAAADHATARYDQIRNALALRMFAGQLDDHAVEEVSGWLAAGAD